MRSLKRMMDQRKMKMTTELMIAIKKTQKIRVIRKILKIRLKKKQKKQNKKRKLRLRFEEL